jgi:Helix-turn-helix domain
LDDAHYSSKAAHGYRVEDESGDRRYFTQIPNIIFELGMSREAMWLYVHLKRVAGDSGECFQSLNTLAKKTLTSKPTLIKAKAELVRYGLIRVRQAERGDKPDVITIRNIWKRNILHFDEQQSLVNLETRVVNKKTTPGKGEPPKKNAPKKKPSKNVLSEREKRRANLRAQERAVFGKEMT